MRRAVGRADAAIGLTVEIAADIAARHAETAHERDHDVGEILADALPRLERLVNRRVDARRLRTVGEPLEHLGVQPAEHRQRVRPAFERQLAPQPVEQRRDPGEVAGVEQLPELAVRGQRVEPLPGAGQEGVGQRLVRAHFYQRFGGEDQPRVPARNVEVMHRVAVTVVVHLDA